MMMELTDEDKQRIEQASILYSGNHNLSSHLFNGFIKGAEYATLYERQQQSDAVRDYVYIKLDYDGKVKKINQLEAERDELIEALMVRLAVAGASTESESNFLQRLLNSLKTK